MSTPTSHPEVIALWPSKAEFARDVGIKPSNARQIAKSGVIPARHFHAVAAAVARAGFPAVTYADLVKMAR